MYSNLAHLILRRHHRFSAVSAAQFRHVEHVPAPNSVVFICHFQEAVDALITLRCATRQMPHATRVELGSCPVT